MRPRSKRLLVGIALLLSSGAPARAQARVACIGDSITYGAQLPDREHLCYPAQLGARFDSRFEVRNFGVGGSTLLRAADRPYVETDAWREVLEWRPQIAVVILGTNDTVQSDARRNWEHSRGLVADARAMARDLLDAGAVRVQLCAPTPMFPDAPGLSEERRADLYVRAPRLELVRMALAEVAAELPGVHLQDLARVFGPERTTDGVHPDPFGAEALAEHVAGILTRRTTTSLDVPLRRRAIDGAEVRRGTLAGFPRFDFPLVGEETACTLVAPHTVAQDDRAERPWLHRLRADEDDLALELALLDRGFHVVFCDVPHSEDDWEARERWRDLKSLMETLGLGDRCFTEAEEAGGGRLLVEEPRRRRWRGRRGPRTVAARPRDLLAAAGLGWNPAAWPATSAEHRPGAGWGERTWHEEVAAMKALAREHPELAVAFLGDSITQGLTGTADRLARAGGPRAIDRHLGARGALALGLSGDRTEHVLWRIEHGALVELDPRVVVLQVGVNNVTAAGHSAEETAEGIAAVVASLRQLEPQADVVVCGPFPAGPTPQDPVRAALADARFAFQGELARLGVDDWREHVHLVDLWPLFLDGEGRPNERMRADQLHVNEAGQKAWLAALEPVLAELLD